MSCRRMWSTCREPHCKFRLPLSFPGSYGRISRQTAVNKGFVKYTINVCTGEEGRRARTLHYARKSQQTSHRQSALSRRHKNYSHRHFRIFLQQCLTYRRQQRVAPTVPTVALTLSEPPLSLLKPLLTLSKASPTVLKLSPTLSIQSATVPTMSITKGHHIVHTSDSVRTAGVCVGDVGRQLRQYGHNHRWSRHPRKHRSYLNYSRRCPGPRGCQRCVVYPQHRPRQFRQGHVPTTVPESAEVSENRDVIKFFAPWTTMWSASIIAADTTVCRLSHP